MGAAEAHLYQMLCALPPYLPNPLVSSIASDSASQIIERGAIHSHPPLAARLLVSADVSHALCLGFSS